MRKHQAISRVIQGWRGLEPLSSHRLVLRLPRFRFLNGIAGRSWRRPRSGLPALGGLPDRRMMIDHAGWFRRI
jgi:hypothetical protein